MINSCTINDIDRIIELGNDINSNFKKVNSIKDNLDHIIGYYYGNKLVGFIYFEQVYEVIDILYIVVDKLYRKNGIGTELLSYLLFNKEYDRVLLEVRTDNINAIKLYKKFNFKIINIRKNYYNNLDGYVMEMKK